MRMVIAEGNPRDMWRALARPERPADGLLCPGPARFLQARQDRIARHLNPLLSASVLGRARSLRHLPRSAGEDRGLSEELIERRVVEYFVRLLLWTALAHSDRRPAVGDRPAKTDSEIEIARLPGLLGDVLRQQPGDLQQGVACLSLVVAQCGNVNQE